MLLRPLEPTVAAGAELGEQALPLVPAQVLEQARASQAELRPEQVLAQVLERALASQAELQPAG